MGSLPGESVGQIWELEVQRQKATLVLAKGCFVRGFAGKPKLIEPVPQENELPAEVRMVENGAEAV